MLLTRTLELELGFAKRHLVLSLLSLPCRNPQLRVPPWCCRGSLSSMYIHGNGPVFPVGSSRFHMKLEHLLLFQQGCARRGIPSGCSEKGVPCFCSHDLWGVCIQVSEWATNYNSCNLLRFAIKGCLEICSSLQNVNTLLLILILNIQLTDCHLITYVNIPLESWFWANNLTWTVFPLNKVYPFTICYPTGWRKRTISKLWGGLCPFQEL